MYKLKVNILDKLYIYIYMILILNQESSFKKDFIMCKHIGNVPKALNQR